MPGLIRADLAKLFRTKSLYVCLGIAVILGASMAYLYHLFWVSNGQQISSTYALFDQMGMDSSSLDEAFESLPRNNIWSFVNTFFLDGSIWYLASVCVCLFAAAEYSTGTYRNVISRGCSRLKVFSSKLFVSFAEVVMVAAAYVISGTVTALFTVEVSSPRDTGQVILIFVIYLCLFLAMASFYLLMATIFRKTGLAVAAALVAPIILAMLLRVASLGIKDVDRHLSKFLLPYSFTTVQGDVAAGYFFVPLLTAAAYILVSLFAAYMIFRRAEIK